MATSFFYIDIYIDRASSRSIERHFCNGFGPKLVDTRVCWVHGVYKWSDITPILEERKIRRSWVIWRVFQLQVQRFSYFHSSLSTIPSVAITIIAFYCGWADMTCFDTKNICHSLYFGNSYEATFREAILIPEPRRIGIGYTATWLHDFP